MKPKELEASGTAKHSLLARRAHTKVRRQSIIILVALLLGPPSLEAAAPSTVPTVNKETVVFKASSRAKNEKFKKKIEENLRKSREWHQKMREKDLRKKDR